MSRVAANSLLLAVLLGGCAAPRPVATHGLQGPAPLLVEEWPREQVNGFRVVSPHYVIFSTIEDRQKLMQLAQLMEGALSVYRSLAPQVSASSQPMECYIFANRGQWAAFTSAHTGDDAAIYLRVNRGGYTIGDWFVAYWIGDWATYSVAAHEGWHQYVARHLKGRLPPFLEEGLACLFEEVQWEGGLPRWDLSSNRQRLAALRAAADSDDLYPLDHLIRMHAGQVVGKPSDKIETFYAQSWAFARFLYDGEQGRYRPALRRMLTDAARGSLYDDTSQRLPHGPVWDPATAAPMLTHYLAMPLNQIEQAYAEYVRQLVGQN